MGQTQKDWGCPQEMAIDLNWTEEQKWGLQVTFSLPRWNFYTKGSGMFFITATYCYTTDWNSGPCLANSGLQMAACLFSHGTSALGPTVCQQWDGRLMNHLGKSSCKQYVNEWVWLCSNKTLSRKIAASYNCQSLLQLVIVMQYASSFFQEKPKIWISMWNLSIIKCHQSQKFL